MNLNEIDTTNNGKLPFKRHKWFADTIGGITTGGIYLLWGQAGSGKSTILAQITCQLARARSRVKFLLNEQQPAEFQRIFLRSNGLPDGKISKPLNDNITVEEAPTLEELKSTLKSDNGFHDVIVLDSIQGQGMAPTARKTYGKLIEFFQWAKSQHITVFAVCHATKRRNMAGPYDLAHAVDVIMSLSMASGNGNRFLMVEKNRFAPTPSQPLKLIFGAKGQLTPDPHQQMVLGETKGFDIVSSQIVPCQTNISIPQFGQRGEHMSTTIGKKQLKHILNIVSRTGDNPNLMLNYSIECYLPGGISHRKELDLPIAISIIAAQFQKQIPLDMIFAGELDLAGNLRQCDMSYWHQLLTMLNETGALADIKLVVPKGSLSRLIDTADKLAMPCPGIYESGNLNDVTQFIWEIS